MNLLDRAVRDLSSAQGLISACIEGLSAADSRRRETEKKWSMLETLHHMWDEEREDFRPRIQYIFDGCQGEVKAIDPENWVMEREYNKAPLERVVRGLLMERQASLKWLRDLGSPDWSQSMDHAKGPLSAMDLLQSWRAHDLLHVRQLLRCRYWLLSEEQGPSTIKYAGQW